MDPVKDSLAIMRVRMMLDSIRVNENRPTVALVLSGGGAKGAAYVGLLRYMEEVGIPVDVVCGTSMGGIIGGLIAMGYDAAEMDQIIRSVSWPALLGNKLESKYLSMRTKDFKSRFMFNLPFHYSDAVAERRARLNEENPDESTARTRNLLASLPTGYVNGFNIDNLLSSLTVGYHGNQRFSDLPIPYFCVSSDLVTCKANYSSDGDLIKSIRATMAIPGVFSPVRMEGMILVDGGTRNNFPVDIARAVGADIVIGAEMGDRDAKYSDVNFIGDILARLIAMLGDDARANSVSKPDLYLKPDNGGYGMLSFSPESINMLIESGYKAAKEDSASFAAIRAKLPADIVKPVRKKARNINKEAVLVNDISLTGVSLRENDIVRKIADLQPNTFMDASVIEDALKRLQATDAFESVSYSLKESEDGRYSLSINCMPKQLHRVALGLRFDLEELVSVIANVGLYSQRLSGSSLDMTLRVGNSQKLDLLYTYHHPGIPALNVQASAFYKRGDFVDDFDNTYNARFFGHSQQVFLSTEYSTFYNIKAGIRNEFSGLRPEWILVPEQSSMRGFSPDESNLKDGHLSAYLSVAFDTFDDEIFPKKGIYAKAGFTYDFFKYGCKNYEPAPILNLDVTPVIPIGRKFAIIPDIHFRSYFAGQQDGAPVSLTLLNYVGGDVSGRHFDHQIRFVGFNSAHYARDHVGVANLDIRYNPVKNLYFSLLGGYARESDTFNELFASAVPSYWAVGAQAAYNTIAGPVKLQFHWSDLNRKFEYYISFGLNF